MKSTVLFTLFLLLSAVCQAEDQWALASSFKTYNLGINCSSTKEEGIGIVRDGSTVTITAVKLITFGTAYYPREKAVPEKHELQVTYHNYRVSDVAAMCMQAVKIVHEYHGVPEQLKVKASFSKT